MTAAFEVELVAGPQQGKTDTVFSIAFGEHVRGRSVAVVTTDENMRKYLERRFLIEISGVAMSPSRDTVLRILRVAQLEEGRNYHTIIVDTPSLSDPRHIAMVRGKCQKVVWVADTSPWHWRNAR